MDTTLLRQTVRDIPDPDYAPSQTLTLFLTQANAKIMPWGLSWIERDKQIRDFFLREPFLKSTVFSIAATRAALSWELDGPPRTVKRIQEMLIASDLGKGWVSLMMKVAIDLLISDNGAFIEVIRQKPPRGRKPENMPVRGLVHLASNRCIRTGNPETPIIYIDENGRLHKLEWYRVITLEEMPMPYEEHYDRQLSFASRVLEGAQVIAEIARYKEEKVSGRFSRAIHLVGGVSREEINDQKAIANIEADNAGLLRYMEPIILASLDPNAKVSHVQIDLASLPDAFDEDTIMKWYITLLALASGGDFQDLAPLPGGNLGTASQSEILHRKSRIKGVQLWMKLIEHKLKIHKVLPSNVSFTFSQQDAQAELEEANIAQLRSTTRAQQIQSGEITPEVARQMAVDVGDLKQEHLVAMGQQPNSPVVTVNDEEDVSDDLLSVDRSTPISLRTAMLAAKWWRMQVDQSPIQSAAPISEAKLKVFEQSLRNRLQYKTAFGTGTGWLATPLIYAAMDAGIPAIALRHRLPDNYITYVDPDQIRDSRGQIIYQDLPAVQKSVKIECHVCQAEGAIHYVPLKGRVGLCDSHAFGLKITGEKPTEIAQALVSQAGGHTQTADLLMAALMYAFESGFGKSADFNRVKDLIYADVEKLRPLLNHPEALTGPIYTWYMRGVRKGFNGLH